MDATSLLLILMSGCYITDSLKLSESTSTPKYACGETIVLTCSRAAGETAIPDELTWKQNGISWSTCFKTTNNDCTVVSVGNRKFSSDVTKGEYNLTLTTATLEDTGTWLCEALSYSTASLTLTIRALPKGVLHVYERNGKLTLETCFAPSSLMVEWFFEDSEANEALTPQTEGSFNESGSCSASVADCIASTTQKYIKQFSFAYDSECGLKVKARLTSTETFIGSIPVFTQTLHGICIRDLWWWLRWVVLTLFLCKNGLSMVSIVQYACAENDKVAPTWAMFLMIIALYVFTVWAVVMIILLFECTVKPVWCIVLAALSVYATVVSGAVLIYTITCCSDRKNGQLLKKLHRCDDLDEEERKNLAAVLVVIFLFPWTLGLILLVPLCVKRGRFAEVVKMFWCHNDEEDHPQGQGNVAHSDKGRGRAADSSKQKTKHEEALIETSSKTDSQHHRPQPPAPLPGIGQSHRDVEEPHYKNSRGLSSNFDDQKGLPLVDVRKQSLPPISATAKGDDDSPEIKKKKKKKKKREGNDTGRSDDD